MLGYDNNIEMMLKPVCGLPIFKCSSVEVPSCGQDGHPCGCIIIVWPQLQDCQYWLGGFLIVINIFGCILKVPRMDCQCAFLS